MSKDIKSISYMMNNQPESLRPINFPGPKAHLVIIRPRRRLLRKACALDKGSYEHTQFRGPYGKVRRNATRYSRRCE